MKGKSSLLATLLVLVAGLVLLICCNSIRSEGIVILGGIIFLVPSIINMVLHLGNNRDENGKRRMSRTSIFLGWVTSVAGVVLGMCMLVFSETFIALLPFVFGVVVLFAAVFHLYALLIGYRPIKFPGWMYLFPLAIAVLGVCDLFLTAKTQDKPLMILTGCGLILFSLACFFESWFLAQYNKMQKHPERYTAKNTQVSEGSNKQVAKTTEIKSLDD